MHLVQVTYIVKASVAKLNEQLVNLDVIEVVPNTNSTGALIGFYVFYRESSGKDIPRQLALDIEHTDKEPVHEGSSTLEHVEETVRKDLEYIRTKDELTRKERDQERDLWNQRLARIKQISEEKRKEEKEHE